MNKITKNNLNNFMEFYNYFHDSYIKKINYDLDKTQFIELLNFYDTLSVDMKDLFIRNILLIILEVSQDDDLDLPFN